MKARATPFDGLLGIKPGRLPQTCSAALVIDGRRLDDKRAVAALARDLTGDDSTAARREARRLRAEIDRVRCAQRYQRLRADPEAMARRKAYQEARKEQRREYLRRWRAANHDRIRQLQATWAKRKYHENLELKRAQSRAYYAANREAILQRLRDKKARRHACGGSCSSCHHCQPGSTTHRDHAMTKACAPSPTTTDPAAPPLPADVPDAVPRGYWEAADGSLVPISKISDLDKTRDAVVKELVRVAQGVSDDLAAFKAAAMSEVDQFVAMSAAQYGVQMRGAAGKGNVTLSTFDGRLKVEKQVADRIAFDERLQVAKALIDTCLRRWSKGSNDNLKVLVNGAFQVDKAGRVSVGKVLALRGHKISDPEWLQAMEAVADSMRAVSSVSYLRFYRRDDASGEYLPISLNAAAV